MKLADVLNIDPSEFSRMDKKAVHDALAITRSVARKRVKRIEQSKFGTTSARSNYNPRSMKGLSFNQLKQELKKDLLFLNNATSTVTGAKKVLERMNRRIHDGTLMDVDTTLHAEDMRSYWAVYNRLIEEGHVATKVLGMGSNQLQQVLAAEFNQRRGRSNKDLEQIYANTKKRWENAYEEMSAEEAELEEEYNNGEFYSVEDEFDDEVFS